MKQWRRSNNVTYIEIFRLSMSAKPSFWYTLVYSVFFSINCEIPDCSLKTFVSVQKSTLFDQRMLLTVVAYKNKYLLNKKLR